MKKDPLDRFLEKVQVGPLPVEWTGKSEDRTECLLWTAYRNRDGYGEFWFNGRRIRAHKFIFLKKKGPLLKGLEIDHICRVRHCVNYQHLEAVTKSENLKRSPLFKELGRIRGLKNRKNNLPEGVTSF